MRRFPNLRILLHIHGGFFYPESGPSGHYRDAIFFYINLGLSRRKLLISVILIDFLSLAVLMAIVYLIYG